MINALKFTLKVFALIANGNPHLTEDAQAFILCQIVINNNYILGFNLFESLEEHLKEACLRSTKGTRARLIYQFI